MPEALATPSAPSVSTPTTGGSSPTPSTPSTPSTPTISTPSVDTGDGGHEVTTPQNPSKFKFKFDDDGGDTEIDLSDVAAPTTPTEDSTFKFEKLDAIRESHPDLYKEIKSEMSKVGRLAKYGFKTPEDVKAQTDRISGMEKTIGTRPDGKVGLDAVEATLGDLAKAVIGFQQGDKDIIAKVFDKNPFLKLLCDACHTKFTSDIGELSDFTVCDRCWIKVNASAADQR